MATSESDEAGLDPSGLRQASDPEEPGDLEESSDSDTDGYDGDEKFMDADAHEMCADATTPRAKGTASEGYIEKRIRSGERARRCPTWYTERSDNMWSVRPGSQLDKADKSRLVILKEKRGDGREFEVYEQRIGKAKLKLNYDNCADTLKSNSCQCQQGCSKLLRDPEAVRQRRVDLFSQCAGEVDVTEELINKIKATGGKLIMVIDGTSTKVCKKYYASVLGVGLSKLKKAMKIVKLGGRTSALRASAERRPKVPVKGNVGHAFWAIFFSENCQAANDETLLFPTDQSYPQIYDEYFVPWFERQVLGGSVQASDRPSFSTWKKARRAPEFKNVKERAKHFHARCETCSQLRQLLLQAFASGVKEAEYKRKRRLHNEEVANWRKLEETVKAQAVNAPDEVMVVMHDGTGACGLPKMSHRGIKNMTPTRFEVVPWLGIDYSQGKRMDYIYTSKLHVSKSTNYLLSMVHCMLRRTKSDYTKPNFRARKLIVIADSASENKNNETFAYYADLVDAKWFDSVELLFGPVGHTHNGVDAVHKIHNVDLGAFFSGDIGHLVQHYDAVWGGGAPGASILQRVIDWKKYYKDVVRKVCGFRKSIKRDTDCVRGFRIARQANGTIDLTWKLDPADPNQPEWLGKGGFAKTAGFFVLKSKPVGLPESEPQLGAPATTKDMKDKLTAMRSNAMVKAMKAQGLEACVEFNCKALETGVIPIHRRLEETTPAGQWGILCEVGAVEGKRGNIRLIEEYWDPTLPQNTRETLWALPEGQNNEHAEAVSNTFHVSHDRALKESAAYPLVRYANEGPAQSEVSNHPRGRKAIEQGREQAKKKKKDEWSCGDAECQA